MQHICESLALRFLPEHPYRGSTTWIHSSRVPVKKNCTNSRLGYEALRLHKRQRWTSWSNFPAIFHVCHLERGGVGFHALICWLFVGFIIKWFFLIFSDCILIDCLNRDIWHRNPLSERTDTFSCAPVKLIGHLHNENTSGFCFLVQIRASVF